MKISKAGLSLALAVTLAVSGSALAGAASQTVNVYVNGGAQTNVVDTSKSQAVTNWGNENTSYIEVVGVGLNGFGANRQLAKRAAVVDAYRNLAEATQGVQVDADTTVEKLTLQNDTIRTHVSALIRGARIIGEGLNGDGSYYVKMRMPLFGSDGLAGAVLPGVTTSTPVAFPAAGDAYQGKITGAYTGLIIDARGLGLEPTYAPVVYDENGRGIYGIKNIDGDYAISHGMVEYTRNQEMVAAAIAGNSRAGANPLVVKAVKAKLGANGTTKVSAVISVSDADQILKENERAGFLNKYAVVFEL
jgi:hypothetical protein